MHRATFSQQGFSLRGLARVFADSLAGNRRHLFKRHPKRIGPIDPERKGGDAVPRLRPVECGAIKRTGPGQGVHACPDFDSPFPENIRHLLDHLVCLRACHSAVSQSQPDLGMSGNGVANPHICLVGWHPVLTFLLLHAWKCAPMNRETVRYPLWRRAKRSNCKNRQVATLADYEIART